MFLIDSKYLEGRAYVSFMVSSGTMFDTPLQKWTKLKVELELDSE